MKNLRNKMFYIREDIDYMKGLFNTEPIAVWKLDGKYDPA